MASSILKRAPITGHKHEEDASNWRSVHTEGDDDEDSETSSIHDGLDHSSIIKVKDIAQLKDSVEQYGNMNVEVDVFNYDVTPEAKSRARFKFGQFIFSKTGF